MASVLLFCSALVLCGASSRVAAAMLPCDALHAFENGSVSAIVDAPRCLRTLRAEMRTARDPFSKSALSSAVIIGDNRLASRSWRRGAPAEARRYWKQSVSDGRIELVTSYEKGVAYFLERRYARAFHWFLCRTDGTCDDPQAVDDSLQGYGVSAHLIDGERSAARGDFTGAEASFLQAAHQPVPLAISGNPQSFVMLGMVELCQGKRSRAIEHLIEASQRTGKGAPEVAPDAFWAGVAAEILLTL